MWRARFGWALAVLSMANTAAQAQDGYFDSSFGPGGHLLVDVSPDSKDAGKVLDIQPDGKLLLAGTLRKTGTNSPIDDDCNGPLEVYGWNLMGNMSGCTFTGNGNAARGTVSLNTIGPLQDNGGLTLTHALLAGSEAINSTNNQGCIDYDSSKLTTDQRGAARGAGLECDVGAFEYGAVVSAGDEIFKNSFD